MNGTVEGIKVLFTVDTGVSITIVSTKVFDTIPTVQRPKLQLTRHRPLINADGRPIEYKGQALFTFQFGEVTLSKVAVVASIEDDVLIGADILLKDPSGPADLIMSEGRMIFHGMSVPMECVGIPEKTRKVHSTEKHQNPAVCEKIIEAYISVTRDEVQGKVFLVEGTKKVTEEPSLVFASCLVDISDHTHTHTHIYINIYRLYIYIYNLLHPEILGALLR